MRFGGRGRCRRRQPRSPANTGQRQAAQRGDVARRHPSGAGSDEFGNARIIMQAASEWAPGAAQRKFTFLSPRLFDPSLRALCPHAPAPPGTSPAHAWHQPAPTPGSGAARPVPAGAAGALSSAMPARYRPRRSCLSVPASSERFIAKARDLPGGRGIPGPRGRGGPVGQGRRPGQRRRRADLRLVAGRDPRRPGQRRHHPVGPPGRGGSGRRDRRRPRCHRAAEGHRPWPHHLARPAADPARAGDRPHAARLVSTCRSRTPAAWPVEAIAAASTGSRPWCSGPPTSWPVSACRR